ncbi:efflux RND transporter periplasmic adaptor subunit [Pseudomarimonas salicorniae]|uniref:Efflux RND transporter periplasmic adaptor subunit n=1 Tax=Pseudomarimonas salicorniae TaxID=2933270 RepID=A0ABT0GC46_9GAMM|nr:efflux RND transporter periplasmic adaptor subunit [Lysobacter sp. CAU 1642]MCK7592114.1 efflux RND transporter periplasmic adaptor subunit [Lysobacter sp. CAU 1642]
MIRDTSAQDRPISAAASPERGRLRWWLAAAALLGLGVYAVGSWFGSAGAVSSERLRFATVQRGDLVRDVMVNGRVVAANSPTLFASYSGTVSLRVAAGEAVDEGQVLAVIDSPELNSQFDQESSRLQQLDVEVERQKILAAKQKLLAQRTADEQALALTAARREAERSERAYERGALSEVDWLRYQDAVESAEILSRHAQADAELEARSVDFDLRTRQQALEQQRLLVAELGRRVEQLRVRAPVDGVIGTLAVADRAAVMANTPLLTVVDLSHLEIEAEVPESYADELAIGMPVELRVAGAHSAGTISAISPEVVGSQVLARIRFAEAAPAGLRQNQRVTGRILFERREAVLTVARGPFLDAEGGRFAYRVVEDSAERVPIRIGATSIDAVEIVEGLQAGDRIVISGTDQFASSDRITLTP